MHTATPAAIRLVNRAVLLNLIRQHGPVSRAELAKRSGLFRSTVSDIVDQLLAEDMVYEERRPDFSGGRFELRINNAAIRVLGWVLHPETCHLAAAGLNGELEYSVQFPTPADAAQLPESLQEAIDFLEFQVDAKTHRGYARLGIAVWGKVEAGTDQVSSVMGRPEWLPWDLAAEVRSRIRLPLAVDTVGNAGTLAELWDLPSEAAGDFVFIVVGDHDVAAGVCNGHQLQRGRQGSKGPQIGHMPLGVGGLVCECGRERCWRAMVSHAAIWRQFRAGEPWEAHAFRQWLHGRGQFADVGRAAFEQMAVALAQGLRVLEPAFSPGELVIGGLCTAWWDDLERLLRQQLPHRPAPVPLRRAQKSGEVSLLQGAVCLALEPLFAIPQFG